MENLETTPTAEQSDLEMRERVNRHQIANEEFSNGGYGRDQFEPDPRYISDKETPMEKATGFAGPKWEYRVLVSDQPHIWSDQIESQLNGFGSDGWELTSVAPQEIGFLYYFKRQVVS